MLTTLILKTKIGSEKSETRFIERDEISGLVLPENVEAKVIGKGGSIVASKAIGKTKLTMAAES